MPVLPNMKIKCIHELLYENFRHKKKQKKPNQKEKEDTNRMIEQDL